MQSSASSNRRLWLATALVLIVIWGICHSLPVRQKWAVRALLGDFGASVVSDARHRHWIVRHVVNNEMIARVYLVTFSPNRPRFAGSAISHSLEDSQTPDVAKYLQCLPDLETLIIEDTGISDIGIEHLSHVQSIRELDLSGTRITDDSIPFLSNMRNLRAIDVTQTRITRDGVRKLQRLRPDISVEEMNWGCPRGVCERIY
jgi:hypothetical protein